MPCYSPLRGVLITTPQGRSISFKSGSYGKGLSLPCGRCIGCRLEKARQWAVRIMHESKMHDESCFITLTYDNENVPSVLALGEVGTVQTVLLEHCQAFMKRLRERLARLYSKRVRFFLCAEYGEVCKYCGQGRKICRCKSKSFIIGRPHYHAVIFGYSFPDKKVIKSSGEFTLYDSQELSDLWTHGNVTIGELSFDSALYVANYATKKINGKKADAHYKGRKPEFLLMSRRPGIGKSFIERFMSDVYPADSIVVRGMEARPPRYYDKVFEKDNPAIYASIKEKREKASCKLEAMRLKSGDVVYVAESNNDRRLAVRKRVAEAKKKLKSRNYEV